MRTALGWEPREAPRASEEQPLAVHLPEYVALVAEMSSRSASFDADTPTSPGSYEAALRAAGGACALVEALAGGGERTGLALRPPGHHAEHARAMGFCLFANVAVAARYALDSLGAERIFVLDWDVHHGNGTNTIFHGSREVLFCSIHQYPFWPGTGPLEDVGEGDGEGFSPNLSLRQGGSGDEVFLSLVEHVCVPIARRYRPDLILISAGYDAHRDDPLGGSASTAAYGAMAGRVLALGEEVGAPVGAVLEGGYDLRALASSVAATMEALGGAAAPAPEEPALHPLAERGRCARALPGSLNQLR